MKIVSGEIYINACDIRVVNGRDVKTSHWIKASSLYHAYRLMDRYQNKWDTAH